MLFRILKTSGGAIEEPPFKGAVSEDDYEWIADIKTLEELAEFQESVWSEIIFRAPKDGQPGLVEIYDEYRE